MKLVALHSTASAPGLRSGSAPRAHSSMLFSRENSVRAQIKVYEGGYFITISEGGGIRTLNHPELIPEVLRT